jgi:hypothetical protein
LHAQAFFWGKFCRGLTAVFLFSQFHERGQCVIRRHGNPKLGTSTGYEPVKRVNLRLPTAIQILSG